MENRTTVELEASCYEYPPSTTVSLHSLPVIDWVTLELRQR